MPIGRIEVHLTRLAPLDQPTALAVRSGDDHLYVTEQGGRVQRVPAGGGPPATVLDLSGEVAGGFEQGLLGIAFAPDGGHVYLHFTNRDGDTRLIELAVGADGSFDTRSRRQVLAVDQPFSNHNGGQLAFGPDGFLYIGLGDGGGARDPNGNAQSLTTLLGKVLRIDPRPAAGGAPYSVPADNPFAGRAGARPEIWAYGLRNPWRFSFDRETGDLWIGDVGQSDREEIDYEPAPIGAGSSSTAPCFGSGAAEMKPPAGQRCTYPRNLYEPAGRGGRNYGWDRLEGTRPVEGDAPADAVPPIFEYGRDQGATVIGGFVYRGTRIPGLGGTYVHADFYRDELRALRQTGGRVVEQGVLAPRIEGIASFGEDGAGELYVLSFARGLWRLDQGAR